MLKLQVKVVGAQCIIKHKITNLFLVSETPVWLRSAGLLLAYLEEIVILITLLSRFFYHVS